MVVFTLSMPGIGSWNVQWSGQGKVYARAYPNRMVPKEVIGKSFYHSWDDGWSACVDVEKMDYKDANKLMKNSSGFMGYDWMIESIIRCGDIRYRKDWDLTKRSTINEV